MGVCLMEDFIARQQQPCWECAKACGGCAWSRSFQPIQGWDAEKRVISNTGGCGRTLTESYYIRSCPEYEQEAERDPTCY